LEKKHEELIKQRLINQSNDTPVMTVNSVKSSIFVLETAKIAEAWMTQLVQ
jgi:hypothetical protein